MLQHFKYFLNCSSISNSTALVHVHFTNNPCAYVFEHTFIMFISTSILKGGTLPSEHETPTEFQDKSKRDRRRDLHDCWYTIKCKNHQSVWGSVNLTIAAFSPTYLSLSILPPTCPDLPIYNKISLWPALRWEGVPRLPESLPDRFPSDRRLI